MTSERNHVNAETPAEVRGVEAALEELAQQERGAASPALEDRLFMVSRGALRGRGAGRVVVRRIGFMSRMRVAAGLAIVGALGAMWMARMGSPAGTDVVKPIAAGDRAVRLEQDVEWLLAMRNTGEGLEGMADVLDLLLIDAETIGDSLGNDWPTMIDDGAGT